MTTPGTTTDRSPEDRRSIPLDTLDDALVGLRRMLQGPGYRRRLFQGLSRDVELGLLRLLRAVQRTDPAPSIGALAEVLAVDPSTASRLVERALGNGYLERRPCAQDGRKARIHLTAPGQSVLEEATARRRELLREVTGDWPVEELDALVEMLHKLQAGFDRLEAQA